MASEIQPIFNNSLIEANRALIELGAIHCRERDNSVSKTVRDCLFTYTNLLTFQQSAFPSAPDHQPSFRSCLIASKRTFASSAKTCNELRSSP